jgi:hypothetical protein
MSNNTKLNDAEKILEYAEQVSLLIKDNIVNKPDKVKLLEAAATMGRIVSRAYAIKLTIEKEDQQQIDEYLDVLKAKYNDHECKDACAICEEYFYAKGWDGLAEYANRK